MAKTGDSAMGDNPSGGCAMQFMALAADQGGGRGSRTGSSGVYVSARPGGLHEEPTILHCGVKKRRALACCLGNAAEEAVRLSADISHRRRGPHSPSEKQR